MGVAASPRVAFLVLYPDALRLIAKGERPIIPKISIDEIYCLWVDFIWDKAEDVATACQSLTAMLGIPVRRWPWPLTTELTIKCFELMARDIGVMERRLEAAGMPPREWNWIRAEANDRVAGRSWWPYTVEQMLGFGMSKTPAVALLLPWAADRPAILEFTPAFGIDAAAHALHDRLARFTHTFRIPVYSLWPRKVWREKIILRLVPAAATLLRVGNC